MYYNYYILYTNVRKTKNNIFINYVGSNNFIYYYTVILDIGYILLSAYFNKTFIESIEKKN